MLFKVVQTVESVKEILKCDHSNEAMEQYSVPCGVVYYVVQGGSSVCVWMESLCVNVQSYCK